MDTWWKYETWWDRNLVQSLVDPVLYITFQSLINDISKDVINILDLWCWEGSFYWECIYKNNMLWGHKYTWIDISKVSYKNKILSFLVDDYNIRQGNAEKKLDFFNNNFDLAFSKLMLHNLSDLDLHFKEVNRIIKNNSVYFVVVLNTDYIIDKIWRTPKKWEKFNYNLWKAGVDFTYYFHTEDDIVEHAENNWFKKQDFSFVLEYKWNNISSIKEKYPRAKKINPFDFIMLKKN